MRIGRAQHAEGARRRDDHHRLGLSCPESGIEMLCELPEEAFLAPIMPVRLAHSSAAGSVSDGRHAARSVGALLMRVRMLLLEHFQRLQIGKLTVADVLQY